MDVYAGGANAKLPRGDYMIVVENDNRFDNGNDAGNDISEGDGTDGMACAGAFDAAQVLRDPVSRRTFLTRMSAAGLGALALPLLAGCGGNATNNGTGSYRNAAFPNVVGRNANEVVLNYALTLKIAEADLYRQALNRASGRTLTVALDTTLPKVNATGDYRLTLSAGGLNSGQAAAAFLYLVQFAYVEATHRDYLTATLAGLSAPLTQANSRGYQYTNNEPGADLKTILTSLLTIEETGVRAFLGAVPTITDNLTAQTITAIYSTEARHAAAIAALLGLDIGPVPGRGQTIDLSVTGAAYPHSNTFEYYAQPADALTKFTSAYFTAK